MYNSECCCRYSLAEPTIAYANLELIKPSVRETYSFKYVRVSRLQLRGFEIEAKYGVVAQHILGPFAIQGNHY